MTSNSKTCFQTNASCGFTYSYNTDGYYKSVTIWRREAKIHL